MSDITPKQARFVEEYLIDLNAKEATIRAGYSTRTAKQRSHAQLQNASTTKERMRRYVTFHLAEVAVPRPLFQKILSLIAYLRPATLPP